MNNNTQKIVRRVCVVGYKNAIKIKGKRVGGGPLGPSPKAASEGSIMGAQETENLQRSTIQAQHKNNHSSDLHQIHQIHIMWLRMHG